MGEPVTTPPTIDCVVRVASCEGAVMYLSASGEMVLYPKMLMGTHPCLRASASKQIASVVFPLPLTSLTSGTAIRALRMFRVLY